MNLWDIVILAALLLAVFFAIRSLRHSKGGCSCGCGGCEGCTHAAECKKDSKQP